LPQARCRWQGTKSRTTSNYPFPSRSS
jgi:hypothetical protein